LKNNIKNYLKRIELLWYRCRYNTSGLNYSHIFLTESHT